MKKTFRKIIALFIIVFAICSLSLSVFAYYSYSSTVKNSDYQLRGKSFCSPDGITFFWGDRITKCSVYSFTEELDGSPQNVYTVSASLRIFIHGVHYKTINEQLNNAAAASKSTNVIRKKSTAKTDIKVYGNHYSFDNPLGELETSTYDECLN